MTGGTIGYQTAVQVIRPGLATYTLICNGDSLSRSRTSLATDGAKGDNLGVVGSPYAYDADRYEGSLSFELDVDNWTMIRDFILVSTYRNTGFSVFEKLSPNESYLYTNCLWNSFSMTASEGSVVTCDLGVVSHSRTDSLTAVDGFINDRTRAEHLPKLIDRSVPFWATSVSGFSNFEVLSWTFTIENPITPFPICTSQAISSPREKPNAPTQRAGRGTAAFEVALWGAGTPSDIPGDIVVSFKKPFAGVSFGSIRCYDTEIDSYSKPTSGKNEAVQIEATYSAYGRFPLAA